MVMLDPPPRRRLGRALDALVEVGDVWAGLLILLATLALICCCCGAVVWRWEQ